MPPASCPSNLQALLDEHVAGGEQAGAVAAVLHAGKVYEAASGSINVSTQVEATADSIFMIGSITKVLNAALVMTLVDDGAVELDAPVRRYLPEFRVADAEATEAITVRHLLCHTSGMQGDFFFAADRAEDTIANYLAACAELTQLHAPGEMYSYCNSGTVVAGGLVERVTGQSWHEAMRNRLLEPLDMAHSTTLPEDAIRFRAAVGHTLDPETSKPKICSDVYLPFSVAPAGGTMHASAGDMIRFAAMFLNGGRAASGRRVLSETSVEAMRTRQIKVPHPSNSMWWSIGWGMPTPSVLAHRGSGHGVYSVLHLAPDRRFALAVLTNCYSGIAVAESLSAQLLKECADVSLPAPPKPPRQQPDVKISKYTGRYENIGGRWEFIEDEGKLLGSYTITLGVDVDGYSREPSPFVAYSPYAPDYFVPVQTLPEEPQRGVGALPPVIFAGAESGGAASHVFMERRAFRRVA